MRSNQRAQHSRFTPHSGPERRSAAISAIQQARCPDAAAQSTLKLRKTAERPAGEPTGDRDADSRDRWRSGGHFESRLRTRPAPRPRPARLWMRLLAPFLSRLALHDEPVERQALLLKTCAQRLLVLLEPLPHTG